MLFLKIAITLLVLGGLIYFYRRFIFFTQMRIGKNGKPFRIIKLRTMTQQKDSRGALLPDSQRVTFIGSILRKYSIDELPQIINILRGEMNLIGPRPLPPEYLPLYTPTQARRHEIKPGLTGWAQVNGRNALSWQQKFELDVWYIDNRSFWLDCQIIFLTFKKLLRQNDGDVIAEPFNGQN
ncbi:MAG: sugar transferase [Microscillaceae bacterium]|jgi:sugar transferase EpsL|nr:sugar transferase [Microscillaceae bacterium]